VTEIQELREIVQAQAVRLTDTRAIAQLNEYRWEQASDRIIKIETRIKHLEAVVFEEGEPEGHELVEDVQ